MQFTFNKNPTASFLRLEVKHNEHKELIAEIRLYDRKQKQYTTAANLITVTATQEKVTENQESCKNTDKRQRKKANSYSRDKLKRHRKL